MKKSMTGAEVGTAAGIAAGITAGIATAIAGLLAGEYFFHIALDASTDKSALLKPAPGTEKKEKVPGEEPNAPEAVTMLKAQYEEREIESFDQFVILLKNTVSQLVYKHAISTVVPSRPVSHHSNNAGGGTRSNYHHGSSAQNTSAQQDSEETE